MLEKLYSPKDLSEKIGKSPVTLRRWRSEGKGPRWMVVKRSIRYRESDVVNWLRSLEEGTEGAGTKQ
jgi:predicted site-specific integrase-resolvase